MVSHKKPLYNEIEQEISNNIVSIKIPKNRRCVPSDGKSSQSRALYEQTDDAHFDRLDKKQWTNDGRVNVVTGNIPRTKSPEEEVLLLRTKQEIASNRAEKHTLEIHFKGPRSYVPIADPGPPPAMIVPRQSSKKHVGIGSYECECDDGPPAPCTCKKPKAKRRSKRK